jgi:hypothetical protein
MHQSPISLFLVQMLCVNIYAEFTNNNYLNDEHIITPNRILDALLKNPK